MWGIISLGKQKKGKLDEYEVIHVEEDGRAVC